MKIDVKKWVDNSYVVAHEIETRKDLVDVIENFLNDHKEQLILNGVVKSLPCERCQDLETEQQFQIFSMLKPKMYLDGNEWCCLYGENIQNGVVGFGTTPLKAILDFNNSFNEETKS